MKINVKEQLERVSLEFEKDIKNPDPSFDSEMLSKKYLGRKGLLSNIIKNLKELPESERRQAGARLNNLRERVKVALVGLKRSAPSKEHSLSFDQTEPGVPEYIGKIHILHIVRRQIEEFFASFGFSVFEGPELETDYYNFEALNIPKDHPARDLWDTFWVKTDKTTANNPLLLRPHTSPMQIRVMEKHEPPLAVIIPGRTFRHEATDARHEHTFDQIEGFLVDRRVRASHLKFILHELFRHLFGKEVKIKIRPSYFPFTEPSFELFMSCPFCKEKGCSSCGSGWFEMLGAGMIHPNIFKAVGYQKNKYTGFAFGLGLARIAMLKYGISDIRFFYQNDLRAIKNF